MDKFMCNNSNNDSSELYVLRLSEKSKHISLEALRSIHGVNLNIESCLKNGVEKVEKLFIDDHEAGDIATRHALFKLESYGFHKTHCLEAYKNCGHDLEAAIFVLYRRYMNVSNEGSLALEQFNQHSLQKIRASEILKLQKESGAFQEYDGLWTLKFKCKQSCYGASDVVPIRNRRQFNCPFFRQGRCKFQPFCSMLHVANEDESTDLEAKLENVEVDVEEVLAFEVEVRFPPGSCYPYEAPFLFVKTTDKDIPLKVRLGISRKLYKQAREMECEEMCRVYSIYKFWQTEKLCLEDLDTEGFPSAERSLLNDYTESEETIAAFEKLAVTNVQNCAQLVQENQRLLKQFQTNCQDARYQSMLAKRKSLPTYAKKKEILQLIEQSQVVIISGKTGCGKTTQVPQYLLDNWFLRALEEPRGHMPHINIICTEPRRISAISVAKRVAEERRDDIGNLVGYQIRLNNKTGPSTRLTYCTTAILLRRLESDPLLSGFTHVIMDEVHERSVESDLLLLILKYVIRKRSDLKVIIMSATLNTALFSKYFGDAPILDIPSMNFPVQKIFLENIFERCGFAYTYDYKTCRKLSKQEMKVLDRALQFTDVQGETPPPLDKPDETLTINETYRRYADYSKTIRNNIYLMDPMIINAELIASVLQYIINGEHEWPRDGTILVFLPGCADIRLVYDSLLEDPWFSQHAKNFVLLPLYAELSSKEQQQALKRAPIGKRKIVLSTNIAETSVTIEDCSFVIDSGLMKEEQFNITNSTKSLDLVWISRANAEQRKGRAGRVMPGVCINLYTSHRYHYNMLEQQQPDMQRVSLDKIVMHIKTLSLFAKRKAFSVLFETLEAPPEKTVLGTLSRLRDIGALDANDIITPLGHHLAKLPVDVRVGKLMILGVIFQCLDNLLTLAAFLSIETPFVASFSSHQAADECKKQFAMGNSDHLTMLKAYRKWLQASKGGDYKAKLDFAKKNCLCLRKLNTIADLKHQYLELLVSIGFVSVNVPKRHKNDFDNVREVIGDQYNKNAYNVQLLNSLIGAALYPNIVKLVKPNGYRRHIRFDDIVLTTRDNDTVRLKKNSACKKVEAPFLCYQQKTGLAQNRRVYTELCSNLSLTTLVLFAGSDLKVQRCKGELYILIQGGWIIVKAEDAQTAELVLCLRKEFCEILDEKMRNPSLDLSCQKNSQLIINNIICILNENS